MPLSLERVVLVQTAKLLIGSLVVLSLVCLLLCQSNYLSDTPVLQEAFLNLDFTLILAFS